MSKHKSDTVIEQPRAALYARVSTGAQLDNTSPDAQLKRAAAYCDQREYNVVARHIEDIGGGFVLARSKFTEFLDLAAAGQLDVIVVDIPDRLGRGDAIAKLELLAEMHGARVEYAQAGRDSSTIEGMALKATDQLVSGIEKLNIRRRTRDGRRDWATRGRAIASRNRPYGYHFQSTYDEFGHKQSCILVLDECEAGVVRDIFDWYTSDCLTVRAVALRLNNMGIRAMKGGLWSQQAVHNILTNTAYRGEWRYGKAITKEFDTPEGVKTALVGHRQPGDPYLVIVACPAVVTADVWFAAQDQRRENVKKFVKPTVNEYLLRGRVQCGRCQGRLVGNIAHGNTYYRCWRKNITQSGACPARPLNGRLAERLAWDTVVEALKHPERLLAGAAEQRREALHARRLIEASLAGLTAAEQKDQEGLGRVFELYRDGDTPKSKYLAEKARIAKRAEQRDSERADLESRLAEHSVLSEHDEAYIREFSRGIARRLDADAPTAEKVRLFDLLRVACIFDDRTGEYVVSGLMGRRTLSTRPAPG